MKAAIFDGRTVVIKNAARPEPKPSQVLIRVRAAGICGTDIAVVKGFLKRPVPLILGHEVAGDVAAVGHEVDVSWTGKRVTVEINSNIDNNCYFCRHNILTQCVSRKAIGLDVNGGFAEYMTADGYLLHEIPPELTYQEAVFIEPLASAYQVFEMMPLDEQDRIIAIFGPGRLGLLLTQVARTKGLKVIMIGGSKKKLALARQFGVSQTINRHDNINIHQMILSLTQGLGADIVADTTGNPNAIQDIVASCRTRGKIHIKSTHGLSVSMPITEMVVRELTLYTSRCGPFDKAIKGLRSGQISVSPLISKEYPLIEINEALASYEKDDNHIKSIIVM